MRPFHLPPHASPIWIWVTTPFPNIWAPVVQKKYAEARLGSFWNLSKFQTPYMDTGAHKLDSCCLNWVLNDRRWRNWPGAIGGDLTLV